MEDYFEDFEPDFESEDNDFDDWLDENLDEDYCQETCGELETVEPDDIPMPQRYEPWEAPRWYHWMLIGPLASQIAEDKRKVERVKKKRSSKKNYE